MASLRDVGLSEYEARIYRALLGNGTSTAKEVSTRSDVPMGRVYDVLADLQSADLVRAQTASRPKKYAPVDPETALDRLLDAKQQQLDAEFQQYEATVAELQDQFESPDLDPHPFWTVAIGPEDTIELLVDRLSAARDRLVLVAVRPSMQIDIGSVGERIAEELARALERGVSISVLLTAEVLEEIPSELLRQYRDAIGDHPEFAIRIATEPLAGSFNLIDRSEVCIEVPNPLEPGEAFGLIDLKDLTFAENVYDEFEPRWKRAEPLWETES